MLQVFAVKYKKEVFYLEWLNMKQICKKLSVGSRTVFNYIIKGMPAYKVGKAWRFDEQEVDEWIRTKGSRAAEQEGEIRDEGI
jgi:excisionase family DNA binding protein